MTQNKNHHPCMVIDGPEDNYACVSRDVLQHFVTPCIHDLPKDYAGMLYDQIESIFTDSDPLRHWNEIKGMVSVTDHHVLRFILQMNIPIDKFIRYELESCGLDESGEWVGFEEAKKIWRR